MLDGMMVHSSVMFYFIFNILIYTLSTYIFQENTTAWLSETILGDLDEKRFIQVCLLDLISNCVKV